MDPPWQEVSTRLHDLHGVPRLPAEVQHRRGHGRHRSQRAVHSIARGRLWNFARSDRHQWRISHQPEVADARRRRAQRREKNAKDPIDRVSSRVQAVGCFFPPTDFLNYGGKGEAGVRHRGILFIPWLVPAARISEVRSENIPLRTRDRQKLKWSNWMRKISPIYHVTADTPPTLIIHGDADKLVPIEQSKDFMVELENRAFHTGSW